MPICMANEQAHASEYVLMENWSHLHRRMCETKSRKNKETALKLYWKLEDGSWQMKNRKQYVIKINRELFGQPLFRINFWSTQNVDEENQPKHKWKKINGEKLDDQKWWTKKKQHILVWHVHAYIEYLLWVCVSWILFEITVIKEWTCVISKIRFIKCVREHKRVNVVGTKQKTRKKGKFSVSHLSECEFYAAGFEKSFHNTVPAKW